MGSIFITKREKFRVCQKLLVSEGKSHVFLVYDSEFTIEKKMGKKGREEFNIDFGSDELCSIRIVSVYVHVYFILPKWAFQKKEIIKTIY